jgi:hypothetical protein
LEDQRIETWFVSLYRPVHKYFEAACLEWLLKTGPGMETAYPLVHGRKFLPKDVRDQTRSLFVAKHGERIASDMELVIDQYLTLTFPTDNLKGWGLIRHFVSLLKLIQPPSGALCPLPSDDALSEGEVLTKGTPPQKAQKDASQACEEFTDEVEALDAEDDDDEDDAQGDDDGAGNGAEDDDQGEDDDDDQGHQGGRKSAKGDQGEPDDEGGTDHGPGTGSDDSDDATGDTDPADDTKGVSATSGPPDLEALKQSIMDAAEAGLDEAIEEMARDVEATVDDIHDAMRHDDGLGGNLLTAEQEQPIMPGDGAVSRKVQDGLNRLRMDLEPEKHIRQSAGRPNIKRMLTAMDHNIDLFDQWDDSGEAVGGVEVVINVDLSASMRNVIDQTSRILWALKRAFDVTDIRATVLGFSDDWSVLYRPGERADSGRYRHFAPISGTCPESCLVQAIDLLSQSRFPNRAIVTLTDGGWMPTADDYLTIMEPFHRSGGSSLVVGLDQAVAMHGLHSHQYGKDIRRVEELPEAVMVLVDGMLQRRSRLFHPA